MAGKSKAVFRAHIEQVEPNLFRASYRGDLNPEDPDGHIMDDDRRLFPDSHIGTDAESVKSFVESLAHNRGYAEVVWE